MEIENGVDPDLATEFDLAEALRWCWRHRAQLDFDSFKEDEFPRIRLTTPLRHPEGELDEVTAECSTQALVKKTVIDMISRTRERVNLE